MVARNATGGIGSGSFNPRPVTCFFRALQQSSPTWLTLCFFPLLLDLETEDAIVPKVQHLPPARTCFWVLYICFVDLNGL